MQKKSIVRESIKFAGVFISVCIGSGFATGQEIMQFFSCHGAERSIYSALTCMIVLSYCGAKLLEIGNIADLKSSNDIFTYLWGKTIGNLFKIFMPIFFLCSFVVMVSGAGASINQYYGLDKEIGSLIMIILSLISVLIGMNKVVDVLGNIGPIIIIVSIGIGYITIFRNYDNLINIESILNTLNVTKAVDNWYLSGIIYSGLNIIMVAPFLVGTGATSKNKKSCILGGILGGVLFMVACLIINLGILSDIKNTFAQQIPTLYMANSISSIVGILFSVILILGIYTTAVPLLWSICNSFFSEGSKEFNLTAFICCIIAFLGRKMKFSYLVNLIYPISGVLGLIIIVGIFKKDIKGL